MLDCAHEYLLAIELHDGPGGTWCTECGSIGWEGKRPEGEIYPTVTWRAPKKRPVFDDRTAPPPKMNTAEGKARMEVIAGMSGLLAVAFGGLGKEDADA